MGPLLACDICDNLYYFSCLKIDGVYLKCMPVFNYPKCFKESFFIFPSYTFKKIRRKWRTEFGKYSKSVLQIKQSTVAMDTQSQILYKFQENFSVRVHERYQVLFKKSRRGISNNYNSCYANASF